MFQVLFGSEATDLDIVGDWGVGEGGGSGGEAWKSTDSAIYSLLLRWSTTHVSWVSALLSCSVNADTLFVALVV